MNTKGLTPPHIKPILTRHSMVLSSETQLKKRKKKSLTQVQTRTEDLPQPRIQPILMKHSMSLTYKAQLKNIKKKRLNVSTFKVPEERHPEYSNARNELFDRKAKQLVPYFRHQKFLTGLEIMDRKLACLNTFSRVVALIYNLRKFSTFVNPTDKKLNNFVKHIRKNKCLIKVNDLYGSKFCGNKAPLIHFYSTIKEIKFFPNLSLKGFSRLKTLEIPNTGLVAKEIHFPTTLEWITFTGTLSADNVKKINRLKNLKRLNLNIIYDDSYKLVFKNLRLNSITVQLAAKVSMFSDPKIVDYVKRFVKETNSKVVFIPRNYSHQELINFLAFVEQNFKEYSDLFQIELPFVFSSPLLVQDSVLAYYSKMGMYVQQVSFSFEIDALYACGEMRKENWKNMLDLVITNASNKLQKVMFHIKYNNELSNKDLLNRMIETAASLIKPVAESKRNETFIPTVEAHIKLDCSNGYDGLSDFLTKSSILAEEPDLVAYLRSCPKNLYINIKTGNISLKEGNV